MECLSPQLSASGLVEDLDALRDRLGPYLEEDPRRPYSSWEVEAAQDQARTYLEDRPAFIHELLTGG